MNFYHEHECIGILESGRYFGFHSPIISLCKFDSYEKYIEKFQLFNSDNHIKLCTVFFENYLPEGERLDLISMKHRIGKSDIFRLYEKFGRDLPGNLSVLKKDTCYRETGDLVDITTMVKKDIINRKHNIIKSAYSLHSFGSISLIAGCQDKLCCNYVDGKIFIPKDCTPTTHIIKRSDKNKPDMVENEFICLYIAECLGFSIPKYRIINLEGEKLLLLDRYDRIINKNGTVSRIFQEDFCQVCDVFSSQKYELLNIKNIYFTLKMISNRMKIDYKYLSHEIYKYIILCVLIGNYDIHGKNLSILFNNEANIAPYYDLISNIPYQRENINYVKYVHSIKNAIGIDVNLHNQILIQLYNGINDLIPSIKSLGTKFSIYYADILDKHLKMLDGLFYEQ